MKVLAILGSPLKDGNTANLLNQYILGVNEGNRGDIEINEIYLHSKNIKNCNGCYWCKSGNESCIIKDDMVDIYSLIEKVDTIIIATPVFVFNMTAQTKSFLDRLFALDSNALENKKMVLLTTYGDDNIENSGVENIINSIKFITQAMKMEFIQNFNISTALLPVKENIKALKDSYQLGVKLSLDN